MAHGATTLSAFQKASLRARTLPELNGLFNSFVRAFGFTAYAVGFAPGQEECDEPFLLIDWPRPWLELYAREGFAAEDAVVAAAATATRPFTWGELQRTQPGAHAHLRGGPELRMGRWTVGSGIRSATDLGNPA